MPHSILIIDDDPQILGLLSNFLGKTLGYDTNGVESGEAGIDAAMQKNYDLAIIDVHMPGQSGPETYTRLKKLIPNLEAIFFTGDQEFEQHMDFLKFSLPADRVIKKPLINTSELTKLIIGILGPPL